MVRYATPNWTRTLRVPIRLPPFCRIESYRCHSANEGTPRCEEDVSLGLIIACTTSTAVSYCHSRTSHNSANMVFTASSPKGPSSRPSSRLHLIQFGQHRLQSLDEASPGSRYVPRNMIPSFSHHLRRVTPRDPLTPLSAQCMSSKKENERSR
jgi:hypothetical protein